MHKNTLFLATSPNTSGIGNDRTRAPALIEVPTVKDDLQADYIELHARHQRLLFSFAKLEQAHDLYLGFYENSHVSYLSLDRDSAILGMNLTGASLLSVTREDVMGSSFSSFVTFWDLPDFRKLVRRTIKTSQRVSHDLTLQRSDGSVFQAQCDCVRIIVDEEPTICLTLIDISERRRMEAEINQLTFHDSLTKLPNRKLLLERLQTSQMRCTRTAQLGAIFVIELDDFTNLNDTYGHAMGDLLSQQVAERLSGCIRKEDTLARLGGDGFVLLAQNLGKNSNAGRQKALNLAQKLVKCLNAPYVVAEHKHRTSACIGVSMFCDDHSPAETLLKTADMALHSAKAAGRNKVHLYQPDMQARITAREVLDADIRLGLQEEQFFLHYQRQVDEHGKTIGFEALIRWEHPERGLLLPKDFIPYAQEKGLIGLLGQQVLELACYQLKHWSDAPHMAAMKIAVNVSAFEFCQPDYVGRFLATVRRIGIDAGNLVIELTESIMFFPMNEMLAKMTALKSHGVRFSLDDFGVGYSSMVYLSHLPLDQLKIDRTFIRDIGRQPNDESITSSIIALGKSLGLEVVAEGVESEEQRDFLVSQGCFAYQGTLFGKPGPAESFSAPQLTIKLRKGMHTI